MHCGCASSGVTPLAQGGAAPAADPLLLTGVLFGQLGAEPEPKRFYGAVTTDAVDGGFRMLLDGRPRDWCARALAPPWR